MYHIDLVETDYFGLQFMDTEQVSVSNKQHTLAFMLTHLQLILIIIIIIFLTLALAGHVQAHQEADPR